MRVFAGHSSIVEYDVTIFGPSDRIGLSNFQLQLPRVAGGICYLEFACHCMGNCKS